MPMTEGAIWKRIIYFAMPVFIGNLFQQLYNTVDSLIVGNYLGSNALAAVSSSGSMVFLLVGFLSGLASGAGVVISRYFGAGDTEMLKKAIHTTVALGFFAGVFMTVTGVIMSPHILTWIGTPEDVMPDSILYLGIFFGGSLGLVLYNTFVGILQAVGDSRHPLYYLIASSVINLILDIIFIKYLHSGVEGAAIATVLAQFISAALCFILLLKSEDVYRISIKKIKVDRFIAVQVLKIGLPSGIQNSIISLANIVVQSNINSFGSMAMAGVGAYDKIEGFGFLPINSFNLALSTFVGQNLGARKLERTKKGAAFGIIMTVVMAEVIGVIIFILAPYLIGAFDSTPEVIEFGVLKARTCTLFYCMLAFSHGVAAVLRGSGRAVVPMIVMLTFWCAVRVTFLTIAVPLTGSIFTVCMVYPMTWFLSSLAFLIYYIKADWMKDFR